MTPAQLAAIKADIIASVDMNTLPANSDGSYDIAKLYNEPTTFIVWKTKVLKSDVGKAFVASALAAITAGSNDKLANFAAWNDTVNPSRIDQRTFFDDVFSVAAGATTRTALLALWKRPATRLEKLLATGTGTDVSPATLTFEGSVNYQDIETARA